MDEREWNEAHRKVMDELFERRALEDSSDSDDSIHYCCHIPEFSEDEDQEDESISPYLTYKRISDDKVLSAISNFATGSALLPPNIDKSGAKKAIKDLIQELPPGKREQFEEMEATLDDDDGDFDEDDFAFNFLFQIKLFDVDKKVRTLTKKEDIGGRVEYFCKRCEELSFTHTRDLLMHLATTHIFCPVDFDTLFAAAAKLFDECPICEYSKTDIVSFQEHFSRSGCINITFDKFAQIIEEAINNDNLIALRQLITKENFKKVMINE